MFPAQALKERAAELGFNLTGIAPAAPSPRLDAYFRWLENGMHGDMAYMGREDRRERRRDLNVILPGIQFIVMVGLDYRALQLPENGITALTEPSRGRIATYA